MLPIAAVMPRHSCVTCECTWEVLSPSLGQPTAVKITATWTNISTRFCLRVGVLRCLWLWGKKIFMPSTIGSTMGKTEYAMSRVYKSCTIRKNARREGKDWRDFLGKSEEPLVCVKWLYMPQRERSCSVTDHICDGQNMKILIAIASMKLTTELLLEICLNIIRR